MDDYEDAINELEERMEEVGFSLPEMGEGVVFDERFHYGILYDSALSQMRRYGSEGTDDELVSFAVHLLVGFGDTWQEILMLPEVSND